MKKLIMTSLLGASMLLVAAPASANHAGTCAAGWDRVAVGDNEHLASYDDNGDDYVCTKSLDAQGDAAPHHRHKDNNGPKSDRTPLN